MAADKYDFIQDLLASKTITSAQREKLLLLTSAEIQKDKKYNIVLEERVQKLEKIISNESNIQSITTNIIGNKKDNILEKIKNLDDQLNKSISLDVNKKPNPSLPKKYLDPSGLYKFLLAYNQDPILKSTCHLIDSNELEIINEYCNTDIYDYNKHYSKILDSYAKINKLFAPSNIKSLIGAYLTGSDFYGERKTWSSDNINWSWSDQAIKNWAIQNIGVPPNPDIGLSNKLENIGFEFASPIKIKEDYMQSFSDLVIHFKKMFHVREDNSLYSIIHKQNVFRDWDSKVIFKIDKINFPENIEFFTDIDKLLQSYDEIIKLSLLFKKNDQPLIQLKLYEKNNSIYFSIHDLNGVYGKSLESAKNRLFGGSYPVLVKKLNGVCNIYLQANFGQNVLSKLTIWDNEYNVQEKRIEQKVDKNFTNGVEHIFEFKRN